MSLGANSSDTLRLPEDLSMVKRITSRSRYCTHYYAVLRTKALVCTNKVMMSNAIGYNSCISLFNVKPNHQPLEYSWSGE